MSDELRPKKCDIAYDFGVAPKPEVAIEIEGRIDIADRAISLLRKYMQHVQACEGGTFLTPIYKEVNRAGITDDEWNRLLEIEDQA